MNETQTSRLINDARFSVASLCAIWMSLSVPLLVISAGVLLVGGGLKEIGAVFAAAAAFSAVDIALLLRRVGRDVGQNESQVDDLLTLPTWALTRTIVARYF